MSKLPQDFSKSFFFFDDQKLNSPQLLLKRIGVPAFVVSFIAQLILYILENSIVIDMLNLPLYISVLMWLFAGGFMLGVLTFALAGIYYIGRNNGHSTFLASLGHTLKKVFLYLFLPAIVLTAILVGFVMLGEI